MGDTLHFIGAINNQDGDQTGAHDDNAGGCDRITGAGIFSDPPTAAQMAWVMNADGSPLEHEAGNVDVTIAYGGATYGGSLVECDNPVFSANHVGLYIHLRGANAPDDDWDEWARVLDYIDANSVEVEALIGGADYEDGEMWLGGALATLSPAVDEWTDDASNVITIVPNATTVESRTIRINIDQDTSAETIVWAVTGDYSHNKLVYLIGHYADPGDMDYGGIYYGGAWNAEWGTAGCKWIDIDGGGIVGDMFDLAADVQGIAFRNLSVHGTNKASANDLFELDASSIAMSWKNCKFDSGYRMAEFSGDFHAMIDCWFGSDWGNYSVVPRSVRSTFIGCVINCNGTNGPVAGGGGSSFINTVFIDGIYGITNSYSGLLVVQNCTFYNQTIMSIKFSSSSSILVEQNNIFMPAAAADYAVGVFATNDGSVAHSNYSIAWSIAGVQLNKAWWDVGNGKSIKGPDSQEVDPLFEDAGNSLFTIKNTGLWEAGFPIAGVGTMPGAVPLKIRAPGNIDMSGGVGG